MEKTNTEIIYELLSKQPLRSGELEEKSSIPKTTLFRILNNMIDDKLIRKINGLYKPINPTPSVDSIIDKMILFHQQKLMDFKYRRLDPDKQLDIITEWFIDNPSNLKGNIDDYLYDDLVCSITTASLKIRPSL